MNMLLKTDKPSIKEFIQVYESEGSIIFHCWQSAITKYFEKDESLKLLVLEMDGFKNLHQIWRSLNTKLNLSYKDLLSGIDVLLHENILHLNKCPNDVHVKAKESRLSRQISFFQEYSKDWLNPEIFQDKLNKATVMIIGIGGTGSWIAQSLAMANVGSLYLVDDDNIEVTNLNRQPLFREEDIGKSKLTVTKNFLKNLNPSSLIGGMEMRIKHKAQLEMIIQGERPDLVISCADHPSTKEVGRMITEVCTPKGIPHIIGGGYNSHIGMLGTTVIPGKTGCFGCYLKKVEKSLKEREGWAPLKKSDIKPAMGSIAPVAGLIGNFIALDAIKVITGFAEPYLQNKTVDFNFNTNEFDDIDYQKDGECLVCKGGGNVGRDADFAG
jgi:molybdopterin-synthase adenylyltransferase